MSRLSTLRVVALLAAGAVALGGLAACSKGGGDNSADGGNVKIVWWHNITSDPGKTVMQDAADRFMKDHPNVTIEIVPIQNEDLQNKLHTALLAPDAPDMFQQWGGGTMKDQVEAGLLMDVSDVAKDVIAKIPGSVGPWQVDGVTYGLPYTAGIAGVYYSQDLFDQAGISAPPTTWDDFLADIQKLKDAGITPIGLGGKDAWPVGQWLSAAIVDYCGKDVLQADMADKKFEDSCYLDAAKWFVDFGATEPFEDGWISVSAQQGAGSSSGMLANHQVAMEWSGVWETSQVASLTPDTKPLADLHWFTLPDLPGGKGAPGDRLGGGDGFSCLKTAPKECGEFLTYLVGDESQKEYASSGTGIPTNPAGLDGVTTPSLKEAAAGSQQITYLQLWLDQAFGETVGQAINQNSVGLLTGDMTPDQFVQSLKDASLKG